MRWHKKAEHWVVIVQVQVQKTSRVRRRVAFSPTCSGILVSPRFCGAFDMNFWVPDGNAFCLLHTYSPHTHRLSPPETPHVYIGPIAAPPDLYPDQWTVDDLLPDPSADIVLNQAVLMQWLRKYKRLMDKGIYMDVEEYRKTMPKLKPPRLKSDIRRSRRVLKHIWYEAR